jgi:hypothetical protein
MRPGAGIVGAVSNLAARSLYARYRTDGAPRSGQDGRVLHNNTSRSETIMLYTIAVVLIILWLLGMVTSTTMGGFVHVLLVIAVIVILLRLISGRNAL